MNFDCFSCLFDCIFALKVREVVFSQHEVVIEIGMHDKIPARNWYRPILALKLTDQNLTYIEKHCISCHHLLVSHHDESMHV